jgi:hypothetical protein
MSVPETYSPTVGMNGVTQANENVLINFSADASGVNLQFFNLEPDTPLHVTLKRGDAALFDQTVTADPQHGNQIVVPLSSDGSARQVRLMITNGAGKELMAAETNIK